jgi:hypothetical protein
LLSLQDYTELNPQKHKLWMDFNWTMQDCQEGISDIVQIMKLEQTASTLIKDYWETAKKEIRKGQNWDSLSEEEQTQLIKYWAQEKARKENAFANSLSTLDNQAESYKQEIELAKFHEERGKQGCKCSDCQNRKELQGEIKQELRNSLKGTGREECPECHKLVKHLDDENGICRKCLSNYYE